MEITWKIVHDDDYVGPYVSLANPEDDIALMQDPDTVVIDQASIRVHIDYPVGNPRIVSIGAPNGRNFTRAGLALEISKFYQQMYESERQSSTVPEETIAQRYGGALINRAPTDGEWGIWGHDIGDLVLHTVSQRRDGSWRLGIDS